MITILRRRATGIVSGPPDIRKQHLTFVALQSGTFSFSKAGLSYSLDNGATWTALAAGASTPTVAVGDSIMWKNNTTLTPSSSDGIGTFSSAGNFNAEGNVMSLYYGDNFSEQTDLSGKTYAFYKLFYSCNKLYNAENLILPATMLSSYCYNYMFYGCTSLTTAPELPAETLANYCYNYMFYSCTSLTTAPELPAETLANYCYNYMFKGCTRLTTAPELPATTLANYCYNYMFRDCTGLITAPELPATTLSNRCYSYMFYNCTGLTTPPELPATTLADYCYSYMFSGCTSLATAPELPATTLVNHCYDYMFQKCTHLRQVKAAFTTTPSGTYTTSWLSGVASTGTFYKNSAATWTTTGVNAVPSGWTVVRYTP